MEQAVKGGAQPLAQRSRKANELVREFVERVAQAKAQARPGKQRLHTLDRAVKAIGEDASHLVRRLLLKGSALKRAIRLGEGRCAFGRAVAHMPDDPPPDNRGQIDARSEAATMLLIGEALRRQRQPTPRQHGHDVLLPTGTEHAIERHGRDIPDHGAPCSAHSTVGGDQRLPGHVGAHAAIAQDEMGEDREHRLAGGALHPPDGETTQPNTGIVGVARQAATCAAASLMEELKTRREEEGEDKLDTRLGVVKELAVGRFVVEIDGDGAVCSRRLSRCAHVSPPCHQVFVSWGDTMEVTL